jgi:Na+/proline symporter
MRPLQALVSEEQGFKRFSGYTMPITMARILLLFALMFVAPRIAVRHANQAGEPAHPVSARESRWALAAAYDVPLAVTVLFAAYFTWPRPRQ